MEHDVFQTPWSQNGKRHLKSAERQAFASTHVPVDYLRQHSDQLKIGWNHGSPDSSLPTNSGTPPGKPSSTAIDELGLVGPETAIGLIAVDYEKQFNRSGLSKSQESGTVKFLTRLEANVDTYLRTRPLELNFAERFVTCSRAITRLFDYAIIYTY
jgi:hypothetical protein